MTEVEGLKRDRDLRLMSLIPAQPGWRALFVYYGKDDQLERFETQVVCWGHYLERHTDVYEIGDEEWVDDVQPLVSGCFGINRLNQACDAEGWGFIAILEPGEEDDYEDGAPEVKLAVECLDRTAHRRLTAPKAGR